MVIPRPSAAYVMADTPCRPIQRPRHAVLEPCEFGDLDRRRPPSVALIGDSHAGHFRAAVEVVAQARGWRAVAMTHPGCAFSTEVDDAPDGKGRCHRHSQEAVRWLRAHPTVHTVFTSSSGGEGSTPGGFLAMWARVPASVHRIHVIRDVPRARLSTAACVSSVIRRHARPWRACTVPRSSAVIPDTTAQAAARAPARVDLIDLTRYFCNASRCFPVIGGVYAYRDETHINRVFSTTLGPYLLRAIGASRVD